MNVRIVFPVLITFVLTATFARASMRCDTSVVTRGMNFIEVMERCGAPDAEFRRANFLVPGVYSAIEEWFYEFGSNKFRRLLTFENGRLQEIELRPKPLRPIEEIQPLRLPRPGAATNSAKVSM